MIPRLHNFHYSKEQIELLFNSKAGTFGVNFLTPSVFFVVYLNFIPFLPIVTWLILQYFIFAIRVHISNKGLKAIDALDKKAIRDYFKYYLGTIFFNGLLWGSASILVFQYSNQTFIFIYILSSRQF